MSIFSWKRSVAADTWCQILALFQSMREVPREVSKHSPNELDTDNRDKQNMQHS